MWTGTRRLLVRILQNVDSVVLNGDVVEAMSSVRNLGLILDQQFTFREHGLAQLGVGRVKLKTFLQFQGVLTFTVKWNLVNCTVLSHLIIVVISITVSERVNLSASFKYCKTPVCSFHVALTLENISLNFIKT